MGGTSYTDTGLAPGTYYYVVAAVNSSGTIIGTPSTQVAVTIGSIASTASPSSTAVSTSVSEEEATITSLTSEVKTLEAEVALSVKASPALIRACPLSGSSLLLSSCSGPIRRSPISRVLIPLASSLLPPIDLQVQDTGTTYSSISLSWQEPTNSTPATYYGIYRDNIEVGTTTQTSFTDTGLETYQPLPNGNGAVENTPYTYYVVAYNSAGASSDSLPLTASPIPAPGSVTGFSVSVSGNTVNFSSGESAALNGLNGTYETYNFFRATSTNCNVSSTAVGSWFPNDDYPKLSDGDLSPGTYYYCAAALDQGQSPYYGPVSAPIEVTITDVGTTPSMIENMQETGNTPSSITLSWDPSVDTAGILGYEIFGSSSYVNGLLQPTEIGVVATTTYTGPAVPTYIAPYDTNTENMPLYSINNGNLSVLPWAINTGNFPGPENIGAAPGLSALTVGNSAEIQWSQTYGDEVDQSLTWNLYRATSPGCSASPADFVINVPGAAGYREDGHVDTNVPLGTYYYCVAPVSGLGVIGPVSPQVEATVTSSTWGGPTPPGDFTITGVGSSSKTLSWTPSIDPLAEFPADPNNEILYQIYRDGTQIATTSATSFTDTAYTPGSNYSINAYDPSSLLSVVPYHQSSLAVGIGGTIINAIGGNSPSDFISYITSALQARGYTVSEGTDPVGEITGMASKNGVPVFYFDLADQVVTGAPQNNGGQCSVQAPGTTQPVTGSAIPVLTAPDGTIPHISTNFNILVDPSVTNSANINWGSTSAQDADNELIDTMIDGLSPYYEADTAGVLPVPTTDPNPGALVVLTAANIPSGENNTILNGVANTEVDNFSAQTLTLVPASPALGATLTYASGSYSYYVPPGTAAAVVNALNAGETVSIETFNTQYWSTGAALTSQNAAGTDEHELGHGIFGLGDDYDNTNSPMQGGSNNPPIPITKNIYDTIKAIQQKQNLPLSSVGCLVVPTSTLSSYPTSSWNPPPDTTPIVFMNNTYSIAGECTQDQLGSGWINDPTATGGCRMPNATTSATIDNYTPTSTGADPNLCMDNYGMDYLCSAVSCGQKGQYSCPVSVPAGTCLDASGNPYPCTPAPETLTPISPPPPPTDACNPDDPVASPECPSATSGTCAPNSQGVTQCTYTDGSSCSCGNDGTVSCINPDGSSMTAPSGVCQGTCGAGLVQTASGQCIVNCGLYPNDPSCPGAPASTLDDYCAQNPDDPTCETSADCTSDPTSQACQDYCSLNPNDPACNGGSSSSDSCDINPVPSCPDYCDYYPDDPSCDGGDGSTAAVSASRSSLAANNETSPQSMVDQTAIISRSLESLLGEVENILKSL